MCTLPTRFVQPVSGSEMLGGGQGSCQDQTLLEEMRKRGIPERQAAKLLARTRPGQEVLDQLEWGDYCINRRGGGQIVNPTGFYIYLVRENIQPPDLFETSRRKKALEATHRTSDEHERERASLALEYQCFVESEIDLYVAEHFSKAEYAHLIERKSAEFGFHYPQVRSWKLEAAEKFVKSAFRAEVEERLCLPTFEAFSQQKRIERGEAEPQPVAR